MDKNSEVAKLVRDGGCTCAITNGVDTVTSTNSGVRPLIGFIDGGKDYRGYVAADRVVGKAAALLYAYMGVTELYALLISEHALSACSAHGIAVTYDRKVEYIINRRGDGMCPMEHTVLNIDDPVEALAALRKKLVELSSGSK